jgi:hypothetical protein
MSYLRLKLNSPNCKRGFFWAFFWVFFWVFFWMIALTLSLSKSVFAGMIEISGTFSYSTGTYGSTGSQWKRSWGLSAGYYFSELTEIELSAEDIVDHTMIQHIEDTTFHDQIYSVEFVQSLLPKSARFQPFLKAGAGQLLREATGSYRGVVAPGVFMGSLTGILGGGLRLFIHRQFSLKGEATSYLKDGIISTWQDNFTVHFGFSLYL